MQTAVIGAGYIGTRVLNLLGADSGVAFSRAETPGFTSHRLDLDKDATVLARMPRRILYTVPPSQGSTGDARLARLLDALEDPPERIVYLSTSGVYGNLAAASATETSPPAPLTPRARRRLAAEELLQSWCSLHETLCIILRVPGIYGPGRLGLERIIAREPYIRMKDANPGNRIHADDLAGAAIVALTCNIPAGIYNTGDGDSRSGTWFALTVASFAGLPAPPLVTRAEAERTFGAKRLSFLSESRTLDTRKMRQVMGFNPEYANAEDGIRASLAEDGLLRGW
jgi:nucleoside-diphosphate-sugar epimerase